VRLVSLCPSNTEIVVALGLADQLVGVDDWSDSPEVAGLPRIGSDLAADVEGIQALRPDLVLASLSVPGMERNVAALRERDIPHIVLDPETLEGTLESILEAGQAMGVPGRAERVVGALRERIAAAAARAVPGRPALYWEWWPKPLITPGRASWITEMSRLAGGRNVFEDLPVRSRPVTDQEVLSRAPDAVMLCWCGTLQRRQRADVVGRRPGWGELAAVRSGRVFTLPERLFGRPGPLLVDGLELLVDLLRGAQIPQSTGPTSG
jgi:iron complex transport system substrate-binding protein